MTPREHEEYSALRATIRQRGTARVALFAGGIVAWAAISAAFAAMSAPPVETLFPLIVLAATFEAVFALHVAVERIGRYLEVAFDDDWERAAVAFGTPKGAASTDPIFTAIFLVAAAMNIVPALVAAPAIVELVVVGGAHLLFGARVILAGRAAASQRAIDRERFEELKQPRV